MANIIYSIGDTVYLNITNLCTNNCDFCLREEADGIGGFDLRFEAEPRVLDVMDAVKTADMSGAPEVVFCGYGEPFSRTDLLLDCAKVIRERYPEMPIRVNTNGQANLIARANIAPRLAGLIDKISVSLNYPDEASYLEHCRPDYGTGTYDAVLDFVYLARQYVKEVTLTAVDVLDDEQKRACDVIAQTLGCKFKLRRKFGTAEPAAAEVATGGGDGGFETPSETPAEQPAEQSDVGE